MSIIGEAALSVFFEMLFKKLASSELLNFATEAKVYGEIKKWEKMLRKLRLVLDDAEEKKIQNTLVKEWLGELKHLAYDVEDILDEFSTECLRRKVNGEGQAASTSKIRKLIPACCTTFTPQAVMFNSDMMSKVNEITDMFNGILEEMKELKLIENVAKTPIKEWQRPPSTCLKDESIVYGRDGDKDKILELLRCETGDAKIGVIPIVGMGGLGKTTLAKLVYNDDSVDRDFQVKAWVCVSDAFDVMRVTKATLESITGKSSDLKELNTVQLELERCLGGKKFLLVLDDVWTEKPDDWDVLRPPFMDGAVGSKIIVTTRSAEVANMMGTVANYDLKLISDGDCWSLFTKYAFENRSINAHPELETIGRKLVNERCGGLPLAAKALGGLLRSKQRRDHWEEILNNKLWTALDGSSNISRVLYLSYYYLPSYLKRCFAYCAILPKDYEFKQEEIILLWMAEGLIPHGDEKKGMKDLGSNYFDDLISRSFFQASNTDISRFIMHDLISDLAQEVAENVCLILENEGNANDDSMRERVRHSSYIRGKYDGIKKFAPFHRMKCLRTFLPLSHGRGHYCYLASSVPKELLQCLKFLRVLSFRCYNVKQLPNSIGDLKHLRYLDFSFTQINVLPESTTSLCNLQTLILEECRELKRLPARMDKLINLRHLDITGANSIEGTPLEIKELSGLQTLSNIVIGKGFFAISNLMSLKSLQGVLLISNLNNVVDASDAMKARLKDKKGIHTLQLMWSNTNVDREDGEVQYRVLNGLQPHINLKKLTISSFSGTTFPFWIGDPIFNGMVQLRLMNCKNCSSLPQLGMLPNLKELFIEEMSSLQRVGQEFCGNHCSNPFPILEVLCFKKMHNWEEWNVCEFEFKVLHELSIIECHKLSGKLPIHLPSLEKLVIEDCDNFVASLSTLPMLSTVRIKTCKAVDFSCKVDFSSLTVAVLGNVPTITSLGEGFLQWLKKCKTLGVFHSFGRPIGISSSWFYKCPQLMSMVVDEDKEQLQTEFAGSELEILTLGGCDVLEKLPAWIHKLQFLRDLTIEEWPNLVTIPKGTVYQSQFLEILEINGCGSLINLERRQLPPTLKKLTIYNCKNLKSLLDEQDEGETCYSSSSINLEDLEIYFCGSLTSISSRKELPATLKRLHISGCSNLTYVLGRGKLPSGLQSLKIEECEKIESIAEEFDNNSSLETLIIIICSSLKSLPEGLHNLINLCVLEVSYCPCIVFPKGVLSTTRLTKLTIKGLDKLEALPDNMHRLSSLQKLRIWSCPNLVSFPSEGLPSNLTSLEIQNPKITTELFEWGLDRLDSLRKLSIYEEIGEMRCFPPDETRMMLPPSLTSLVISDFPNLEYLSTRGFRHLTSLKDLSIASCPKLAFFPENGLPDSLSKLGVYECPILKQRCEEGKGPEWSNIVNIPEVIIPDR